MKLSHVMSPQGPLPVLLDEADRTFDLRPETALIDGTFLAGRGIERARVAAARGFASVVTFRQNFVSAYSTTPTSYRQRFALAPGDERSTG